MGEMPSSGSREAKYRRKLDAFLREGKTRAQKLRARRILFGRSLSEFPTGFSGCKYDPEVHPAGLVEYFETAYGRIKEAIRVTTDKGDLKFVSRPLRVPSMAGYGAKVGVSRITLQGWRDRYPEFGEAYERAKTIQEAFVLELSAMGGLNPLISALTLKNYQGWKEKADIEVGGAITLRFDGQDEGA